MLLEQTLSGVLPADGALCQPPGSGSAGQKPCLGLLCSRYPDSHPGPAGVGMWPLGNGGAKEALLPVLSSLVLTLTPSPRLWSLLSFLFLLLLGLTFALGVLLAWREGPLEDPSGLCSGGKSQIRAQQCHQLTTTPAVSMVPLPRRLHCSAPGDSACLGALETLSNGSVYQLLVPKGPTN